MSDAQALIAEQLASAAAPCVTSSFQAECVVLLHLLRRVRPDIPVLFLDTVHHFADTYVYRDDLAERWGLNLVTLRAEEPVPGLWQESTEACCARHKVGPLFAALAKHDTWFTGLRREQSPSRASLAEVEPFTLPGGRVLRKVSPLAGWTTQGCLGVREGARDSAAPALRARVHEHRMRAVHDAADRPRQTSDRADGAVRSWNAGFTSSSTSDDRSPATSNYPAVLEGFRDASRRHRTVW